MAEWFGASHLHLQKVRNAIAFCVFAHQQKVAKPDSQVSEAIIQLAFDETELYSKISGSSERGFFHIIMLHARVVLVSPDGTRRFEFVLPPAAIKDTSSRVLNNAIMQRAGFLFTLPAGRVTLIQNSDKANSCVRQASGPVCFGFVAAPDTTTHPPTHPPPTTVTMPKYVPKALHFAAQCQSSNKQFIFSNCMMHMSWTALTASCAPLQITNPMFCSTCLLHRAANMNVMRQALGDVLREPGNMIISFDDDRTAPHPYNVAMVEMLDAMDPTVIRDAKHVDVSDVDNNLLNKRAAARRRLLRLCPRSWAGRGPIVHVCSPWRGCKCKSREDAINLIHDAFSEAFFSCLPPIPAVNRWGKIAGPVAWWLGAISFYQIMIRVTVLARSRSGNDDGGLGAAIVAIGEPETEAYVRAVRQARWRKALVWLTCDATRLRLAICSCIMRPAIILMARTFFDASLREATSVLPYLHLDTSPAERTFRLLASYARDQDSNFWHCINGESGVWTDTALFWTGTCYIAYLGGLFMRCISVFDKWPWLLGRVTVPSCRPFERNDILNKFRALNQCCCAPLDGFTWEFKNHLLDVDSLLTPHVRARLHSVFSMVESSTILTEDRFARARRHSNLAPGRVHTSATVASNHFLGETRAQWLAARDCYIEKHCNDNLVQLPQPLPPRTVGVERWRNFYRYFGHL